MFSLFFVVKFFYLCYTVIMKNKILSPQFASQSKKITTASLALSNYHHSDIAGFNWKNVEFPFLHDHEHYEIILVTDGAIKHTINDVTYTAQKCFACLMKPSDKHKFHFVNKQKTSVLTFVYNKQTAEHILQLYPLLQEDANSQFGFYINNDTFDTILSKTLAAQFLPKEIYEQYTILIILRIISAYCEQKLNNIEANPQWLNDFLSFLHIPENLSLSLPELAKQSTYSYSQLTRLFKRYMGTTLITYIKEMKINMAKNYLLNTSKSITEIALDLHYDSVSSLNHNFKKATGLTPLQFRKQAFISS